MEKEGRDDYFKDKGCELKIKIKKFFVFYHLSSSTS